MRRFLYFSLGFVLVLCVFGCELINPEEAIPGYIVVEPFQITTSPSQGSSSSKITEVWISNATDFLGVYRLPATVPVLAEGTQSITLQAGIKDNGVGALPEIYPFYAPVSFNVDFQPNQTVTLRPSTSYLPGTKFALLEGFENPEHAFRVLRIGGPGQAMQRSTESPFEGQASGLITLDSANPAAEIATQNIFSGLNNTSPFVYLEMDYKSDVPVLVGLVGFTAGGPAGGATAFEAGFLPKAEWNKIYFNLSQLIFESRFDGYQIVLQAVIPRNNGILERNTAKVWIDNVKLVHF